MKFNNDLTVTIENGQEREDIIKLVDKVMNLGEINWHNEILSNWCKANNLDDRQRLLTVSTVFPQKMLWSVMLWDTDTLKITCLHLLELRKSGTI